MILGSKRRKEKGGKEKDGDEGDGVWSGFGDVEV
jgi:hypothetical protein